MIVILAAPMTEARIRKCRFDQNEGRGLDGRTGSGVGVAQVGSGARESGSQARRRDDPSRLRVKPEA